MPTNFEQKSTWLELTNSVCPFQAISKMNLICWVQVKMTSLWRGPRQQMCHNLWTIPFSFGCVAKKKEIQFFRTKDSPRSRPIQDWSSRLSRRRVCSEERLDRLKKRILFYNLKPTCHITFTHVGTSVL